MTIKAQQWYFDTTNSSVKVDIENMQFKLTAAIKPRVEGSAKGLSSKSAMQ